MSAKTHFTTEQAREISDKLGIDWKRFDVEQYRIGLEVELEQVCMAVHRRNGR